MQYPSHSKHQIRQYSGYGVSIATYVNGTEYSEVDVAPPQYVEPTENHTLVASREDVTTNNGSTSHGSDLDVECGRNSKRHSEKKSWCTTPRNIAAAVVGGRAFSWYPHGKCESDAEQDSEKKSRCNTPRNIAAAVGGGRAYSWYPHGKFEIDAEQDSEEKSWWTTPKKIAAAVGVGLLIGGAAVVSILIATNGANESDNSTQIVVGGGSGSSNSNPTFTTEAMSLDTNGLPSSNGFDDGISTYTPSISTEAPIGITDLINLLSFVPLELPPETIVPRYEYLQTDRKYNRVRDIPFNHCISCVARLDHLKDMYKQQLSSVYQEKYFRYQQQLDYNKALVKDINTTVSILESGHAGDPAVHSDRTDITMALQDGKRVLMEEQQALINRMDRVKGLFSGVASSDLPCYHTILRFQGNSALHPKMNPGNFTSEEVDHLNRVVAARERYQLNHNRLELELKMLDRYEVLAFVQAKLNSKDVDIDIIEQDLRLCEDDWTDYQCTSNEREIHQRELDTMLENYLTEVSTLKNLSEDVHQFGKTVKNYPEILTMVQESSCSTS